ncbi:unnamed protein product, partial [marine sediment metagenome]
MITTIVGNTDVRATSDFKADRDYHVYAMER